MGLKTQGGGGGRRSQVKVSDYSSLVPRRGPASPCKGRLSNKSNTFCLGSARNLTSQYLIRDHMVVHYNRILAAKAAVDCSAPKSRLTSIKLADQQRREKLKKKIGRCEEKIGVREAVPPSCPRDSGRLLPSSFRKNLLAVEDSVPPFAGQAQYVSSAASPCGEHCLVHSSPVTCTRKCCQNASRAPCSNSCVCVSRPPCKHSRLPRSHSIESFVNVGCSHKCQVHNPRARNGDLLDRHSECFTKSQKPFTPRTLISDAKPSLSEYRFYTPARRKKKSPQKQHVEAQTQTDMISFPAADKAYARKVMGEQQQQITSKAEDKRCTPDEPERGTDGFQYSTLRETSRCPQKSSPRRTADAEEEELLYLTFIEDVTNEILRLGLFSNRVLDQLFECHIEENKNRLDEGKMRQMLAVLKSDLGCSQDSETELSHASQEALDSLSLQEFDTMEELKFTSKGHRLRKATDSEESLETMDLPLKESSKCESLSQSKKSRETQCEQDFPEDTTEIMDAGTESDSSGMEFEEHPDTSPSSEASLNLIPCDSSLLEVNKELDELEENLAEGLHISHNYS